jgi:hypothetical protein
MKMAPDVGAAAVSRRNLSYEAFEVISPSPEPISTAIDPMRLNWRWMNRRDLFKGFGAIVAGVAIEQAIPLGRIWSFPSQIVIASRGNLFLTTEWVTAEALRILKEQLVFKIPSRVIVSNPYCSVHENGARCGRRSGSPPKLGKTTEVSRDQR